MWVLLFGFVEEAVRFGALVLRPVFSLRNHATPHLVPVFNPDLSVGFICWSPPSLSPAEQRFYRWL